MLKVTLRGKQVADLTMIPITIYPSFQPEVTANRETAAPRTQSSPKAKTSLVRGQFESRPNPPRAGPAESTDVKP
jgi:hypothetical protein